MGYLIISESSTLLPIHAIGKMQVSVCSLDTCIHALYLQGSYQLICSYVTLPLYAIVTQVRQRSDFRYGLFIQTVILKTPIPMIKRFVPFCTKDGELLQEGDLQRTCAEGRPGVGEDE